MSGERIHVVGLAHRVAIIGAILARRWAGEGRELALFPEEKSGTGGIIIARPDQRSVHAELELSLEELAKRAGAVPVFAIDAKCAGSDVTLPFSPFGMARSGIEFHQFWQRGDECQAQPDLADFSLAVAIQNAPSRERFAAIGKLPLQFGLGLDKDKYTAILLEKAAANGAQVDEREGDESPSLVIDCGLSKEPARWSGKTIVVSGDQDIPGIGWQICVNAARRFLALTPGLANSENEQREYSRLAAGEIDRISDMRALLGDPHPGTTDRPALKRKVDVFAACGRIPTEDFEVFGQPEWLAALWGRGIRPRRFDRLAKAMPESELLSWLASMHREISQIAQQGQVA
ncbi:MAG: tryptophan 7-halogenase [Pseudomonadota bacterium]